MQQPVATDQIGTGSGSYRAIGCGCFSNGLIPTSRYRQRGLFLALLTMCLAAWLVSVPATAQPATSSFDIPPVGRVVDQADLLTPATERALIQRLDAHEDATSNQVAVLTVESLGGTPIEDFALAVARAWALGQEAFDNGVLLLIARDDRAMRIEVGYGLEGALPDAIASQIIRYELRPAFRAGDFDNGVEAGVAAILDAVAGAYEPPARSAQGESVPPIFFRLTFLIGFVILPLITFGPIFFLAGMWIWLGFIGLFFCVGWGVVIFSPWAALAAIPGYLVLIGAAEWLFRRASNWKDIRRQLQTANEENEGRKVEVTLAGRTFLVPSVVSSGGSASIGSSGDGFGGGSSFSGGGGSFGGGGASGGW